MLQQTQLLKIKHYALDCNELKVLQLDGHMDDDNHLTWQHPLIEHVQYKMTSITRSKISPQVGELNRLQHHVSGR